MIINAVAVVALAWLKKKKKKKKKKTPIDVWSIPNVYPSTCPHMCGQVLGYTFGLSIAFDPFLTFNSTIDCVHLGVLN